MLIGNFFKVDENSEFENGIVYYRYLPICRKKRKGGESDFPVYVSINSSSITFYLQIRNYLSDNKNENTGEPGIYNHAELFHIPLMSNLRARDNLKNIIKDLYKRKEPLSNDYRLNSINDGTYSGLKKNINKKNEKEEKPAIHFKTLVLDFIFDLEHSQVFKNSPAYEKMEESLRQDLFFSALAAKYDYYHKKEILSEELKRDDPAHGVIEKLYKDFYTAQNQWLDILCAPNMSSLISNTNHWFREIEQEQRDVLFDPEHPFQNNRLKVSNIANNQHLRENYKKSSKWFLRRYDFISAARMAICSASNITDLIIVLGITITLYLILKNLLTGEINLDFTFLDLFIIPVSLLAAIIFIIVYGKIMKGASLVGLLLPRTLMASSSAWLFLASSDEGWRTHFDMNIHYAILIAVFLSLLMIFFMLIEVRNLTNNRLIELVPRILIVFIIGLSYSFVVGTIYSSYSGKTILKRTGLAVEYFNNPAFDNESVDYKNPVDSTRCFEVLLNTPTPSFMGKPAKYNIMYEYELFPAAKKDIKLRIFPGMLVINAFLALFIGIFLQLIFEDKPVTEPL